MEVLSNFPKIECPFIRKEYDIDIDDWREHGHSLKLRTPKVYLVTPEINPGYEWVLDDKDTIAVEKLDGTNIKLKTENGRLISLYNRDKPIDPLQIMKGKTFIIEGVFRAIQKGYVNENGEQAGECIGPKIQGNPYKLDNHIWYPFGRSVDYLTYRSFHKYERNFDNLSSWFKDNLFSRYYDKMERDDRIFAEGLVFYNLKRKEQGLVYRAKLRRDMFDWYYSDKIRIMK